MKIAYGTYAMPTIPLEEAIPALAKIGYDGVEICISPRHHQSLPDQINSARRKKLKSLLDDHGLGIPALFMLNHILAGDAEEHQRNLEHTCRVVELARDLGMRHPPVISMGIGGRSSQWETQRHLIVRYLRDYATLAEKEGFILAGEAHCGAAVDRSERAVWVFDTVNHPAIKLHFDIVHFYLSGEEIEEAVKTLIPYTAHTHITDARKYPDGSFDLLLLGKGELDSTTYVRAMHKAGWTDFITLEVSTRVWSQPDYDPFEAATFSYNSLNNAFIEAGVPRA